MKIRGLVIGLVISVVLLLTIAVMAKPDGQAVRPLSKATDGIVTRTLSNISNWSYWMNYNGKSGIDPNDNSGGIYPRATAGAIFQDGFIWGGKYPKDDGTMEIRVGGQTYNIGTTPGWIQSDGTAISQDDPRVRIYRIRADYKTLTHAKVLQEAAEANMIDASSVTESMTQEIIDQYETDWEEWPADLGAPFVDVDGDGLYDPDVDEAGIANADQVVWFVCNDLNRTNALGLYGSEPFGFELQVTAWAYAQPDARLGQIIFKKYKLINKSGKDINDMYVAQWCDPDLGEASDDLLGCDTLLSMGFVYNGQDKDNKYSAFGLAPASIGYDFFQGPLIDGVAGEDLNRNGVDDAEDYGVFDLKVVGPGKINLPMTGFSWFAAGSSISDPDLGSYDGTLCWWNMLRGYIPTTNIDTPTPWTEGNIPVANGGIVTKYPMAGDPVTETGDLDAHNSFFQPGDRRMALCSGPFTFADGDIQEVVVAIVGGLGATRFTSIRSMKATDEIAQNIYNIAFKEVPKPPTGPDVAVRPFEGSVLLNWGGNLDAVEATEKPVTLGYEFEGYNIYQLPSSSSGKSQATLIATYDVVNGVKTIKDLQLTSEYGEVEIPIQRGDDTGIKRSFLIEKDYLTGRPLYEGSTYYFAVTAYNQNVGLPADKALESSLIPLKAVIQENLPGDLVEEANGNEYELTHSEGTADGSAVYKVIDPYQLTGHDYQVYFDQQHYYLDKEGQWKTTNYPDSVGKKLGKQTDVSPSTVSGVAYTSSAGTRDLKFVLDLVSPDYDYAEGVKLTFPAGIVINSASGPSGIMALINESENSVLFGNEVQDSTDLTGAGAFAGGELMTVNVNTPTLPLTVAFVVYDDGWAYLFCQDPANAATCDAYGISDAVVVNAAGNCVISEEAYVFKSINRWNVKDLTINEVVLSDQTVVNGVQLERVEDGVYYAGGDEVGNDGIPYVDGFQVNVLASYSAPTDFTNYTHTGPNRATPDVFDHTRALAWLDYDQHGKPYEITSYVDHAWGVYGPTASAWDTYDYAEDGSQHGTQDMNLLQLDVELRFTGEYDESAAVATAGGGQYIPVKDGTGSLATLVAARMYDIADHPDPANPGDGSPFLMRIPFEVWDTENDKQISIVIYDRLNDPTSTDDMYAFNPGDRVYCWFLEDDYANTITDAVANSNSDLLTWNVVFWNCDWVQGDVVHFLYDNPIQLGVDKFTFTTAAPTLGDAELAKEAVKKINVFPNPYYAYNSQSTNQYDVYVTFTHLPTKAKVRIFNLAGTLVRTLDKNTTSQFLQWDLKNEANLPVGSGMYIAHIDLPDLGKEKVLKLMVIQDRQILEYY
jgi:hypothetical protein